MAIGGSANFMKEMEESLECSLCTEVFTNPRSLPCLHTYCRDCLDQHIVASVRARQIRCPLCNINTTVPDNGAEGFPVAFHQAGQVELYHKMVTMNIGTRSEKSSDLCTIHKKAVTHVCETCNKLICQTCLTSIHKKHNTTDLKSAQTKHKPIVDRTKKQLQDQKASKENFIQELQQAITQSNQQKEEGIQKVKQQEQQLITEYTKQVQDHSKTMIDAIVEQWNRANEELQALIEGMRAEKVQLQECINHIKSQQGTEAGVVKTSLEDVTSFQDILQDMKHDNPVRHFTVRVDCPRLTVRQEQVAVVECQLEGGGPSTRVADIPTRTKTLTSGPSKRVAASLGDILTRTPTPHTVTARKLHQFDVDFDAQGITCTPAGNVIVCEYNSNTVRMFTQEGNKVMDLQTPPGTKVWDVDSTDTNIYVTDRNTESVLVFDHQGRLVTTNQINNVRDIAGISVSNRRMYISGGNSNNVLEMDLSDSNKLSTQKRFAAGVQLKDPLSVCARGDVVAISCNEDHCVHCVDSRGRIKYTHGTPGQKGSSHNQLDWPSGVVFDRNNNLFISDYFNGRVCVVSDSGHVVGHIDLHKHQLQRPLGITIDNESNLLVACMTVEWSGYCIVKFGYSLQ